MLLHFICIYVEFTECILGNRRYVAYRDNWEGAVPVEREIINVYDVFEI